MKSYIVAGSAIQLVFVNGILVRIVMLSLVVFQAH